MADSGSDSTQHVARRVRHMVRLDRPRWPFIPFGLLPALGLLALVFYALVPFAQGAVQGVTERTTRLALSKTGAEWAEPRVSGQWVVLEGQPPSRDAARAALKAVREASARTPFGHAEPATRVRGAFDWDTPVRSEARPGPAGTDPAAASMPAPPRTSDDLPSPEWRFALEDGVLRLEGEVGDLTTRDRVARAAQARLDPPRLASLDNRLRIGEVASSRALTDLALRGVQTLTPCREGVSELRDEQFSLACEAPAGAVETVRSNAMAPLEFGELGDVQVTAGPVQGGCAGELANLMDSTKVEFASGSAVIAPSSAQLLEFAARIARDCPGTIRIKGHTDNQGGVGLNERLSRARAEAVRTALIERGVSRDRLVARGYGARDPIADNATPEGRARNRRIEIEVVPAPD